MINAKLEEVSDVFASIIVNDECIGLIYFDESDGHTHLTVYDGEHLNGLSILTDNKLKLSRPEGIRQYNKVVK